MSATPFVKWAQREDKVFITVEATGATDSKIELKPEGVFKCSGTWGPDKKEYEVELEFHGAIDVEESKQLVNELKLFFTIVKSEAGPYWPRLLKDKVKRHWLKIDFDKWKDEDDDEEEEKPDNYDAPGMQGMGGMPGGMPPGMGGMPGMGGGGGGPGGMDMEAMMKAMGGMGGGAGGGMPDMAEMMAKMGGGAGGPGAPGGGEDEDDQPDSDDGDMPELE